MATFNEMQDYQFIDVLENLVLLFMVNEELEAEIEKNREKRQAKLEADEMAQLKRSIQIEVKQSLENSKASIVK